MEFDFQTRIDAPCALLEAWHHRPGALPRLIPPGQPFEVLEVADSITEGSRSEARIQMFPGIWTHWTAEHTRVLPGEGFSDIQIQGPFRDWVHTHRFRADPTDPDKCILHDHVHCEPFGGIVGRLLAKPFLKRRLGRQFAWRHARTKFDVEMLHRNPPPRQLHFLITGARGMIGQALVPYLIQAGHKVTTLSRSAHGPNARVWNPDRGYIDLAGLAPIDAVIHLAGENIASGKWTAQRRRAILESRVKSTWLLANSVAALSPRPSVFLCASGVSAYRSNGHIKDESSPVDPATFLGHVVQAWEAAAQPARDAAMRVVHLRLGVVLSPDGGALGKLLPVFKYGLGGPVWHGRMGFPWIALDDVLEIFHTAALDARYEGIINAVAPEMLNNGGFSKTLGRVLHRPTILPLPRAVVLALFGQMGEETLLADHRIRPRRLEELNFPFRFPQLEPALHHMLLKEPAPTATTTNPATAP